MPKAMGYEHGNVGGLTMNLGYNFILFQILGPDVTQLCKIELYGKDHQNPISTT